MRTQMRRPGVTFCADSNVRHYKVVMEVIGAEEKWRSSVTFG